MRVGIRLPNETGPEPDAIRRLATMAEELGFDSIWLDAHVVAPARIESRYPLSPSGKTSLRAESSYADPLVVLAYAAAVTERLRLGTSVIPMLSVDPLSLAKRAATLDLVSGGRLELGIGAGWLLEEAVILGRPTDHPNARMAEAIDLMRTGWREGVFEWHGRFYDVPRVGIHPLPPQRDRVPLWIGGMGESAVRICVEKGAGLMLSRATPQVAASFKARLRAAPSGGLLGCSLGFSPADDVATWRATARAYRDAGVQLLMIGGRTADLPEDRLSLFAREVLPELSA